MSESTACPHCGAIMPPGSRAAQDGGGPAGDLAAGGEPATAPISLLASGSHDETFTAGPSGPRMAGAEPDPILGQFITPTPDGHASARVAAGDARDRPRVDDEDDEDDGPPDRAGSWTTLLLASYASALTMALAWTLWLKPRDREGTASTAPEATQPGAAHQAPLSRTVTPPEPILAEHRAAFRKPLPVGSIEVTPIDVRRESVTLQRSNLTGKVERKDGGKGALVLHLRLRNTSVDAVFAPLDQTFLRDRAKEVVDTFVEAADGERIYPFSLAVESEWSILGQDFGELRPGETRLVSIVTAPDAPGDGAGPFTWRVRLRTGIGRTDVIGVRWPESPAVPSK
jgi:hypothetical protein